MNELFPIARLGRSVLLINRADTLKLEVDANAKVLAVKVNLEERTVDPAELLEEHLKFNPWQETSAVEGMLLLKSLAQQFTEKQILEQIIVPLAMASASKSDE